jgi:hypothetical protein
MLGRVYTLAEKNIAVHTPTYTHSHTPSCTDTKMHARTRARAHTYIFVYTYTHIHSYTYNHTHARIYRLINVTGNQSKYTCTFFRAHTQLPASRTTCKASVHHSSPSPQSCATLLCYCSTQRRAKGWDTKSSKQAKKHREPLKDKICSGAKKRPYHFPKLRFPPFWRQLGISCRRFASRCNVVRGTVVLLALHPIARLQENQRYFQGLLQPFHMC